MPNWGRSTVEQTGSDTPTTRAGAESAVQLGSRSRADPISAEGNPPARAADATSSLVTLVLGIAGVALGVVVIWYPAAIALGLVTIVVGVVTLRRPTSEDPRARSRATVGTMLGAIAILLGVGAAIFLPRVVERADRFFSTMQHDVNHNVDTVSRGLHDDVNDLDRSTARDLNRLERQNRADLAEFEKRSNESLDDLGKRLADVEARLSTTERADLTRLDDSLRTDIRDLDAALRNSSGTLGERIAKLEQQMADIQRELHH